ncbi:hypothetical protein [Paraburkholderia sp. SIMBA_030]|uniref:hypothetical protein n=1 Tax=Paraburkholderia sp. SIMBA_030 TaxID=3085773 RepID=UPI00397B0E7C
MGLIVDGAQAVRQPRLAGRCGGVGFGPYRGDEAFEFEGSHRQAGDGLAATRRLQAQPDFSFLENGVQPERHLAPEVEVGRTGAGGQIGVFHRVLSTGR